MLSNIWQCLQKRKLQQAKGVTGRRRATLSLLRYFDNAGIAFGMAASELGWVGGGDSQQTAFIHFKYLEGFGGRGWLSLYQQLACDPHSQRARGPGRVSRRQLL